MDNNAWKQYAEDFEVWEFLDAFEGGEDRFDFEINEDPTILNRLWVITEESYARGLRRLQEDDRMDLYQIFESAPSYEDFYGGWWASSSGDGSEFYGIVKVYS